MPGGRPRTRDEPIRKTKGNFIVMVEGPILDTPEKVDRACRLIRQKCGAWEGAGRPRNLQQIAELVTFNLDLIAQGREPPKSWITADFVMNGDVERLLTILFGKPPKQKEMLKLLTGRDAWVDVEGKYLGPETNFDRINAKDAREKLNKKDKHSARIALAWEITDEIRQW